MTKEDFLKGLRGALAGLPRDEVEDRIAFYSEMIDDRIEEGMTEENAVAGLDVRAIAEKTLAEVSIGKIVRERVKPNRTLRGWEIALIVLGFPLWFPLIVAAGGILLSIFAVLFSLVVVMWAVDLSAGVAAIGGVVFAAAYVFNGLSIPSLAMLGIAIFSAGLAIGWFFLAVSFSKGTFRLFGKMWVGIKRSFVKKERQE